MKLLPKILIFALLAGVLIQSACAEDPAYIFVTAWGSQGKGDGEFEMPSGIEVDSAGNVYVADTGNSRIQKFDAGRASITAWGSYGSGNGQFILPYGVAVDSAGNVYVADTGNSRIQKFDAGGAFIGTWGSLGPDNGQFNYPYDVAVDSAGNVYVADTHNNRVQKFDAEGTFITTWGSFGRGNGQFIFPNGVAVDSSGNVYVTDTGNSRIQKFDAGGAFIGTWGSVGPGNGQFDYLRGIAVDSAGNVYVADSGNSRIQKFDADGAFITAWGSDGSGNGQFINPYGVAVDSTGNVYVADTGNGRIQKFAPHLPPVADAGGDQTLTAGWALTFDGRNSSDPNANIASYEWWFSEGGAATGPITTRVYEAPGTYYATLTVTDATDFSDSDMIQIIVIPEAIENPMEATEELIADIEALDLPRGTERKVVTKLEEALRYLAHANDKLAAASAELEGEAPDDILERVNEIMESIAGEGDGLATLSGSQVPAMVANPPTVQSSASAPTDATVPDAPDINDDETKDMKDKKDKKDHPVKPDK